MYVGELQKEIEFEVLEGFKAKVYLSEFKPDVSEFVSKIYYEH
ncbi:hypothetical protein [Viridibacillus soli]|nr:hypothetical protein [Viridibacillus soli]